MGREIRKVPPNWNHPKAEMPWGYDFRPMFDQRFEDAVDEWEARRAAWDRGEYPDYTSEKSKKLSYEEYAGECPDNPDLYRPWKDKEATWFQVWETVSEGTPVTPPFAMREELVEYLIKYGDNLQDDARHKTKPWGKTARSSLRESRMGSYV